MTRGLFPKPSLHNVVSDDGRQASFNRERDIPPLQHGIGEATMGFEIADLRALGADYTGQMVVYLAAGANPI